MNFNYGISGFQSEDKANKVQRILKTAFGKKLRSHVVPTIRQTQNVPMFIQKSDEWLILLEIREDLVGDVMLLMIEQQVKKLKKPVKLSQVEE